MNAKILTVAQIDRLRAKGKITITINGVKKRVTKRNILPRHKTVYWYLSGVSVSLKRLR